MNTKTALQKAVDIAGGQSALARAISESSKSRVTQVNIWNWLNTNRRDAPPAEYCPDIESATGVLCEELRPDVSWHLLRGKKLKNGKSNE